MAHNTSIGCESIVHTNAAMGLEGMAKLNGAAKKFIHPNRFSQVSGQLSGLDISKANV